MGRMNHTKEATPKVRTCARPIYLEGTAPAAVLGLHGFGGYPGELALPASRLKERGLTVHIPRLPGHGTSARDFDRTGARDWLTAAEQAYIELASSYEQVHIMGHSMGGLLALIIAERYTVDRLVLMAPALSMNSRLFRFAPLLRLFRHHIPIAWESDPSVTFFDERDPGDDAYLGREYWGQLNLRAISELAGLQKRAAGQLSVVDSAVLLLTAELDRAVSPRVGTILKAQLSGPLRHVHLRHATHLIPYDRCTEDRELAMAEIVNWFCADQS